MYAADASYVNAASPCHIRIGTSVPPSVQQNSADVVAPSQTVAGVRNETTELVVWPLRKSLRNTNRVLTLAIQVFIEPRDLHDEEGPVRCDGLGMSNRRLPHLRWPQHTEGEERASVFLSICNEATQGQHTTGDKAAQQRDWCSGGDICVQRLEQTPPPCLRRHDQRICGRREHMLREVHHPPSAEDVEDNLQHTVDVVCVAVIREYNRFISAFWCGYC